MIIEEASIPGVLRTILIILAIYFLVRLLGRMFKPVMREEGSSSRRNSRSNNRKEGDVTIEYTEGQKKSRKKDSGEGDYVDFEELD
jgi:hypothetical protein